MKPNMFADKERVVVSGISCIIQNPKPSENQDPAWLARNSLVRMVTDGVLGDFGWVPNVFIKREGPFPGLANLLAQKTSLHGVIMKHLGPLARALEFYLKSKQTVLGVHWLGADYSVDTGSVKIDEPIYIAHGALCFYLEIGRFWWEEHPVDSNFYNPLQRKVSLYCPLELADNFTQKAFDEWIDGLEKELQNKAIANATEALERAKRMRP
jgi:hypothetical protein